MYAFNGARFLTVEEFAARVGVTKSYVYRRIRKGQVKIDPALSSLQIVIPEFEVERWLKKGKL